MINPHPLRERISYSEQEELWQEKRGARQIRAHKKIKAVVPNG